ncbi:MAG: hypothetical protein HY925_06400, partial [Elusimicrobia bacterium]|nr:hypothetical protein [Elusimicrobiota bacterium]
LGKGYPGGTNFNISGSGPGGGTPSQGGAGGGGHGGTGGTGSSFIPYPAGTGGGTYDSFESPGDFGSGGGGDHAGAGGGALRIAAAGGLRLDGTIEASGAAGTPSSDGAGGGGGGGSVNLCPTADLSGAGAVRAAGGAGGTGAFGVGGGGGGGRVCVPVSRFTGAIDVAGGPATPPAQPGQPGSANRIAAVASSTDAVVALTTFLPSMTVSAVSTGSAQAEAFTVASSSQFLVSVTPFYELEPSPIVFSTPAVLTFVFEPGGISTGTLAIYRFNGVAWDSGPVLNQELTILADGRVQLTGRLLTASLYGVFREQPDRSAPVSVARFMPPYFAAPDAVYVGTGPAIAFEASDPPLVTGEAGSGVARIETSVDGGPWTLYAGAFALASGRHVVAHRAVDQVGNVEAPRSVVVEVDPVAPSTLLLVNGSASASAVVVSTDVLALATADGGAGVLETLLAVDGSTRDAGGVFSLAAGTHSLVFGSIDRVGNQEPVSRVELRVLPFDAGAPTTTLTTSGGIAFDRFGRSYLTPDVVLSLSAADERSAVEATFVSLDGSAFFPYASSFSLAEGTHTISFYSVDAAGNSEGPRSAVFDVSQFALNAVSAGGVGTPDTVSGGSVLIGDLALNGPFSAFGNASIRGGVSAPSIALNGNATITGTRTLIARPAHPSPFDLAAALAGASASDRSPTIGGHLQNGFLKLSGGTRLSLSTGSYVLNGIELSGNSVLSVSGKVGLFVRGPISLSGGARVNDSSGADSEDLVVFSDSNAPITLTGNSRFGAYVYAPNASTSLSALLAGHLFTASIDAHGGGALASGRTVPGSGKVVAAGRADDAVLAATDDSFAFRDLYAFPNPANAGRSPTIRLQVGQADAVELRIYDVSGELVHGAQLTSARVVDDGGGKGPQVTYDYEWNTGGIGSGIYLYAVTAHRSGQTDIRKAQKLAVVK